MKNTFLPHRRHLLCNALPAASLLMLGLTGCTALPQQSGKTQEALLQRANAYWAAIKDNDRVAAWKYEELSTYPDSTLQAYLKRGGIVYEEVQVLGVSALEGDRAKVQVRQIYSVPIARIKNVKNEIQDEWLWLDEKWYHAHRRAS